MAKKVVPGVEEPWVTAALAAREPYSSAAKECGVLAKSNFTAKKSRMVALWFCMKTFKETGSLPTAKGLTDVLNKWGYM